MIFCRIQYVQAWLGEETKLIIMKGLWVVFVIFIWSTFYQDNLKLLTKYITFLNMKYEDSCGFKKKN
jgi:hypothetical protein